MKEALSKKAVIISAGTVEKIDVNENDFVIAADGGYDRAKANGISVNLSVGDMDSARNEPESDIECIILKPDKDFTDSEFALREALLRGYKKIDIYGATGTRLDHTLANIFMLKRFTADDNEIRIIDKNNMIIAINREYTLSGMQGKTVSFIPADSVASGVTLKGFFFPLNDSDIELGTTLTVSNVVTESEATVKVKKGTLIMMISED